MTKHHEITIVQGDFNAKVGQDIVPGITGKHGLGERNERGSRMIQFCQEHNMKITNTMFSLPPRRLYTWKSPQDRPTNIVNNIINKRYSSFVTKTSTYPGADVPSDHVLLMTKLQTKLRTNMKKKIRKRINVEKLDEPSIKTEIKALIGHEFSKIEGMDSESIWKSVKQSLKSIADNNLGSNLRKRKNEWMTAEILGLMDERRKYKNSNYELNKEVQSVIRAAKNDNRNKQCQEIERLQQLHDDFNLHKKIKEAAGIYRKSLPKVLYNSNNEAVFDITEKKAMWQNYITFLYTDENRSNYDIMEPEPQVGTPITKHETEAAIKSLKMKKACGPDEIPSEILKLIEGDNINILVKLFNCIYETDYEKVFDTVKHDKLVEILASIGIEEKEIRCIKSLYWQQTAQESSTKGRRINNYVFVGAHVFIMRAAIYHDSSSSLECETPPQCHQQQSHSLPTKPLGAT
ncbi:uncharacterized protein [Musca autumnalis]|uniref:uncharacterized protein n=1 Tax=Musca autumnalis TaxID=221902 RepID=UPI003CEC4D34